MRFLIAAVTASICARQWRRLLGKVLAVSDGDTFTMETDGGKVRVRLCGIDAPERGRAGYGQAAGVLSRPLGYWKLCPVCWPEQNNASALHYHRAQIAIATFSDAAGPIAGRHLLRQFAELAAKSLALAKAAPLPMAATMALAMTPCPNAHQLAATRCRRQPRSLR